LPAFFLATFAVTWSLWLTASTVSSAAPRAVLFLAGTFAPGIVAAALTARATGRPGLVALLRRLVDWQVSVRWYVFALSYIAVVKLSVAVIHRVAIGAWPRFGEVPWYLMIAGAIGSTVVGGQAGEELGWRGYALPHLTARWGLGRASVLLGSVWAVWHLPLFFVAGSSTQGQSFPLYLLQVTALSVAMAWLLAKTRGSLLPVMLLHAAVNNTKDLVPSAELNATNPWALSQSPVAWLTVALLSLCAGYFLLQVRRTPDLTRGVAGLVVA
jgi:CAAX protease family protein